MGMPFIPTKRHLGSDMPKYNKNSAPNQRRWSCLCRGGSPDVDFITSPGYLDGRPGRREEIGLPPNTGPSVVISNLGKVATDLTDTEPPTDEELRLLREEVDPQKIFTRRAEGSGWQQQSW